MYAVPEINSLVYYYQFHMRHVRLADPRSHLKSKPLTLNFCSASCAFHCMVYPVGRQRLPIKEICKGFTRFPDREGPKLKSGSYQKGSTSFDSYSLLQTTRSMPSKGVCLHGFQRHYQKMLFMRESASGNQYGQ